MNFETLQLDSPDIPELCREKYRALLGDWPAPGQMDDRAATWAMAWLTATQEQDQGDGEWIGWGGGSMPVPFGTVIDAEYRCGKVSLGVKAGLDERGEGGCGWWATNWNHDGLESDIISYRIVKEPRHG